MRRHEMSWRIALLMPDAGEQRSFVREALYTATGRGNPQPIMSIDTDGDRAAEAALLESLT